LLENFINFKCDKDKGLPNLKNNK